MIMVGIVFSNFWGENDFFSKKLMQFDKFLTLVLDPWNEPIIHVTWKVKLDQLQLFWTKNLQECDQIWVAYFFLMTLFCLFAGRWSFIQFYKQRSSKQKSPAHSCD